MSEVIARIEPRDISTYPVGKPETNPVFFENRVYQGSSGKVYPVPFIDKVYDEPVDVTYQSVLLENEFVRLVLLPEIGGRIYFGQDKTNHDYDFFYRNDVIKPALVGVAGPWISGGVEFNWPQHHRPSTFMPTDFHIEEEPDGAKTVWMSEHDPLNRLKGMHGIRLRPGSSLIELRGRLYNRTGLSQTFLWWANVAAEVHDQYQSFFPPDVNYVADHAVRAMSSFPVANNHYYGVDYANRPGRNDISWYKNIPVPTSYMVCQTQFDFFGGYDFAKEGGFLHVANRHISPGKKQWTWGNHEFGWAWDRELTDENGPYVELMAGVYTDNQPDFSYLLPYETKTFSQFWWPIQGIGPVQQASEEAALRMVVRDDRIIEIGACASRRFDDARIRLTRGDRILLDKIIDIAPGKPWKNQAFFDGESPTELALVLSDPSGNILLAYRPVDPDKLTRDRPVATEPPKPSEIKTSDELYFTGEHLDQYRHSTRAPEPYWEEGLRRDPGDARCHISLGRSALRRGLFSTAAEHLEHAIHRLTFRHPNPVTGEAHYFAGVANRFVGDLDQAYSRFYKATWNYEWRSAAFYQLACIDCIRRDYRQAEHHLDQSLATNRDHNKARVLTAVILRHRDDRENARKILLDLLDLDPLDHWARHELALLDGDSTGFLSGCRNDAQTILDLVFDYADAGFTETAISLLDLHHNSPATPAAVPNPAQRTDMTHFVRAWLRQDLTEIPADPSADHFFPSRLHEQLVLEWVLDGGISAPVAAFGYGNYLFDLKRHEDAIAAWEQSAQGGSAQSTVYRNLGIGYWNSRRDGDAARAAYEEAIRLNPRSPRLIVEFDQLRAKLNEPLKDRLAFLEEHKDLVLQRDDCTVALAKLYNLTGRAEEALSLITSRRFHPWEGGEGAVLAQYTNARILLGQQALSDGDADSAYHHFLHAMDTPDSLGEAYHLLQAKADVNYWIGYSLQQLGRPLEAAQFLEAAASEDGDFAEMAVTAHSPLSYYRGLALQALGRECEAKSLFEDLRDFATARLKESVSIPYFATSLPNILVFDESLQDRRNAENHLLIALAWDGLDDADKARGHLEETLRFVNDDQRAADLAHALAKPSRNHTANKFLSDHAQTI